MSADGVVDVQARLLELLHDWYPELREGKVSIVNIEEKQFRWSRHLIFQVISERGLGGPMILVKLLRLRGPSGRIQDTARPSSNAVRLEYQALSLVYEHLGGNGIEGITAVRPLTYFSDIDALVVEYMPGRDLLSLLLAAGRPWAKRSALDVATEVAYRGGRLLGSIHKIERGPYPRKALLNGEQYRRRLQEDVQALLRLMPDRHARRRLLLVQQAAHEFVSALQEHVTVSYLHSDFNLDNLVQLPDGRVYTIDTTLHQVGPVEDDIANLLVGIDTLKQRLLLGSIAIRPDNVALVRRSFLSGYCTEARFSPRVLLLSRLRALIRRWTGVLSVLTPKVSPIIASSIRRARINPFMLAYLDSVWTDLQKGSQVP